MTVTRSQAPTSEDTPLTPVWRHAEDHPLRPVLAYREGDAFVEVSAAAVAEQVLRLGAGLIAMGVQPGDRVALMSRTRLEWTYLDFAIMAAGAVTVPVYETSAGAQVEWILADSGAVLLIVETPAQAVMAAAMRAQTPACQEVLVIDDGAVPEIAARGERVTDEQVRARADAVDPAALATLIYTSGTTGRPKGCMLTHANLRSNTLGASAALDGVLGDEDVSLLFLPLAHTYARIAQLLLYERGILIGYSTGTDVLMEELQILRPTFVAAVPRVFEKVYDRARQKADEEGRARIFDVAAGVATRYSRERAERGTARPLTRLLHGLFDRLVYRKLRQVFGGRLRVAASGGAALGERLGHFFGGVGITILEGYGLTETSPLVTSTTPETLRIGTVGQPLIGTEVRIAEDGEIIVRGPQVFQGYWHDEVSTRAVLDGDGWFATGDLGSMDADGYLRITGRKKDLIVTAGGKNVSPSQLEDSLRADSLVSDSVVIGDGRPFIAALIALDAEALTRWAGDHDLDATTAEALRDHPVLQQHLQDAVARGNLPLSTAEQIRAFAILPHDLSVESGELTPTFKVRRALVLEEYHEVVEEIYAGRGIPGTSGAAHRRP